MPLQAMQEALALVLMDGTARQAFAKDPTGTLRRLGLKGNDVTLLSTVDANDLAYFATRRNIDRHQALRADAPLTMRLLEGTRGRVQAYFRAYPFSLEDPQKETARFAEWCKQAAKDGTVPALAPDLARYDAGVLRLLTRPYREAKPSARPKRVAGLIRFQAAHRLQDALRSDGVPKARPGPVHVILQRTPDDIRWNIVTPLEATLVALADGKRTEAQWLREAQQRHGGTRTAITKVAAQLRRDGLIAPAP